MTVATTFNRVSYQGNGTTKAFETQFVFFTAADLRVFLVNDATGAATLKTLTTDYTVTGGNGAAGIVTMKVKPAVGTTLVILRVLPLTQDAAFVNLSINDAKVQERALDRGVMVAQQLEETLGRCMKLPQADISGASATLPTPQPSTLIGWNPGGDALRNYSSGELSPEILVTPYAETLLDDADAEEARATLDTYSTGEVNALVAALSASLNAQLTMLGTFFRPGLSFDYHGEDIPEGAPFLLEDGAIYDVEDYPQLAAFFGDRYGGDGVDSFGVPDSRRRVHVGAGVTGSAQLGNQVGDTGGTETHSLTAAENGPHDHSESGFVSGVGHGQGTSLAAGSTTTGSSGSGSPHPNMQPSLVVTKMVFTGFGA